MKKNWVWIVLAFIIFFALSIRLFRLEINSPSIYADEAGGHYIALQSVLNSHSLGQKIYNYFQNGTATLTWLTGLNPFGVRLPTTIYGITIVLLCFLFVFQLENKSRSAAIIALIAAFIASISPWNFMLSRIGHPHLMLMQVFVLLSLIFYLRSESKRDLWISILFLFLGAYEYPSMVVIAPIVALFILFKKATKKIIISSLALFGISALLFVFLYNGFSLSGRALSLAIWRDPNVTAENNIYRGIAGESTSAKVFYNLPTSVVGVFTKNYLSYFSPDFLFLKGDPILRHSTGQAGSFLLIFLPFMLFGAFNFFKNSKQKYRDYVLLWILLSPVPGAITNDGAGYLLRAVTMMPLLTYFVALGIYQSIDIFKNTLLKVLYTLVLSALIAYSTGSFLYGYFKVFPTTSAVHWEYGFKELSDFQSSHQNKLLTIWEDKYPVWYFCFWQNLPKTTCDQKLINTSENINDSRIDLPTDSLLFSLPKNEIDFDLIIKKYTPKYVAIPGKYLPLFTNFASNRKPVETIKYPDQTTSFEIYEISQ